LIALKNPLRGFRICVWLVFSVFGAD